MTRAEESLPQQEHRRRPAGDEMRVVTVTSEQIKRRAELARFVILERHRAPAARSIARSMP